jgi:hypothetical protein
LVCGIAFSPGALGGNRGGTAERLQLVDKLFEQALKMKISQLAKKYDSNLIFELWNQIVKLDGIKAHFRKWIWKPDLTIMEALDCLDEYGSGLEALLRKRQAKEKKLGASAP